MTQEPYSIRQMATRALRTWVASSNESLRCTKPLDVWHTAVQLCCYVTITYQRVFCTTAEVRQFTGPQTMCQAWRANYQPTICTLQSAMASHQPLMCGNLAASYYECRPHTILQTAKRHFKLQNSLCGRAVCIVCGLRPVYLNTTAQPTAVNRTTAQNAVV